MQENTYARKLISPLSNACIPSERFNATWKYLSIYRVVSCCAPYSKTEETFAT
jgi:hypothetical protein